MMDSESRGKDRGLRGEMTKKAEAEIWRRGWDSNPRGPFEPSGFQDRRFQPLTHPSGA